MPQRMTDLLDDPADSLRLAAAAAAAAAEAGVRRLALYPLAPSPPEGIGERMIFHRGLSAEIRIQVP